MNILKFFTKYRLKITALFIFIGIVLKFFVFKTLPHSIFNNCFGLTCFVLVILGCLVRLWAAGVITKNKKLATTGPYHLCRNPLYLGSFLIGIGFTMLLNDVLLWVLILLFFALYIPIIMSEERKLITLFPDEYPFYKKQTGVLYPKSFSFKKLSCNWSFKMFIKNTEYNAWIATALACTVIEFWSRICAS